MKKLKLLTLFSLCLTAQSVSALPIHLGADDYLNLRADEPEKTTITFNKIDNTPVTADLHEGEDIELLIQNKNNQELFDVRFDVIYSNNELKIFVQDPDAINSDFPSLNLSFTPAIFPIEKTPTITIKDHGEYYLYSKSGAAAALEENQTYEFLQDSRLKIRISDYNIEDLIGFAANCSDGEVEAPEECDDGNKVDDDECSNTCQINEEPQAECGNGIAEPGEECDDGNQVNDDECSNACTKAEIQNPDEENPDQDQNQDQDKGGCSLSSGAGSSAGILSLALSFLALGAVRLRKNS